MHKSFYYDLHEAIVRWDIMFSFKATWNNLIASKAKFLVVCQRTFSWPDFYVWSRRMAWKQPNHMHVVQWRHERWRPCCRYCDIFNLNKILWYNSPGNRGGGGVYANVVRRPFTSTGDIQRAAVGSHEIKITTSQCYKIRHLPTRWRRQWPKMEWRRCRPRVSVIQNVYRSTPGGATKSSRVHGR